MGRQHDAAPLPLEQLLPEGLLEALDLQRDRGLREVEPLRGAGDAPDLRNRQQRSQGADVEISQHVPFPLGGGAFPGRRIISLPTAASHRNQRSAGRRYFGS
jgi:hypothetical protein